MSVCAHRNITFLTDGKLTRMALPWIWRKYKW